MYWISYWNNPGAFPALRARLVFFNRKSPKVAIAIVVALVVCAVGGVILMVTWFDLDSKYQVATLSVGNVVGVLFFLLGNDVKQKPTDSASRDVQTKKISFSLLILFSVLPSAEKLTWQVCPCFGLPEVIGRNARMQNQKPHFWSSSPCCGRH